MTGILPLKAEGTALASGSLSIKLLSSHSPSRPRVKLLCWSQEGDHLLESLKLLCWSQVHLRIIEATPNHQVFSMQPFRGSARIALMCTTFFASVMALASQTPSGASGGSAPESVRSSYPVADAQPAKMGASASIGNKRKFDAAYEHIRQATAQRELLDAQHIGRGTMGSSSSSSQQALSHYLLPTYHPPAVEAKRKFDLAYERIRQAAQRREALLAQHPRFEVGQSSGFARGHRRGTHRNLNLNLSLSPPHSPPSSPSSHLSSTAPRSPRLRSPSPLSRSAELAEWIWQHGAR
ncbi:hypothetical protein IE81DRAFT_323556 [Ceraceosorus guamensis]|uniref:Uncharacterized protein n=1 Tax=Ceraceosorus guamensis TaxID=1522189 RepID=A0A316VY65_9BASI|nr:hypothetical protein IE81DRAFT_323556 [Ceraceosorus guamensis]PWN42399.1 hypothetical protein IE81DRAFT_323556 [Ceraceosorus guamensis]